MHTSICTVICTALLCFSGCTLCAHCTAQFSAADPVGSKPIWPDPDKEPDPYPTLQ